MSVSTVRLDLDALLTRQTAAALAEVEIILDAGAHPVASRVAALLNLLFGETIPTVQAQVEVLTPYLEPLLGSGEIPDVLREARNQLGLRAEQLSRVADSGPAVRPSALRSLLAISADSLRGLLAVQHDAAAALEHSAAVDRAELQSRLAEAAGHACDQLLFVEPPVYLPTEAHALRHNPRPPRIRRLGELRSANGAPSGRKSADG